jgi:hypothetical protein
LRSWVDVIYLEAAHVSSTENRLATEEVTMYTPVQTLIRRFVDRAPRAWFVGVGIVLATMSAPSFAKGCQEPSPDGSASCYLTGTYELRGEATTWREIINPTGHDLLVYAYFFDANEHPMRCVYTKMSANDLWEITVNELGLHADRGVAKIVSFAGPGEPRIGIVGNQRIWFRKQQGISETSLHPIQSQLLAEDLAKMIEPNFKECKAVDQK